VKAVVPLDEKLLSAEVRVIELDEKNVLLPVFTNDNELVV